MKKKMLLLLIIVSFLCVFCQIPILAKYKKNEIIVIKDATQIEAVSADDLPIGRYGRTIAITNYTFTSKMSGKLIKIVPKIEGILCVDADEGRTKILDKNLNQLSLNISEWDGNYYIGNVGKMMSII